MKTVVLRFRRVFEAAFLLFMVVQVGMSACDKHEDGGIGEPGCCRLADECICLYEYNPVRVDGKSEECPQPERISGCRNSLICPPWDPNPREPDSTGGTGGGGANGGTSGSGGTQ